MVICPLMSNPDVAREFNELKDATSSRAAYAIWSLNNGNMIDKAPNGEPSILFDALLSKFKNRFRAIREKAKYYTKSFFDTFGDWINNSSEIIGHLDKNGEPTITNYDKQAIDRFLDKLIPAYRPLRHRTKNVRILALDVKREIEGFIYSLLGVNIDLSEVEEKDIKDNIEFFIRNQYEQKLVQEIQRVEQRLSKTKTRATEQYLDNMLRFLERGDLSVLSEYDIDTQRTIKSIFPKLFFHSPKVSTKSMFGYYKHAIMQKKGSVYDNIYREINEPNVKRYTLQSRFNKLNTIKKTLDLYPRIIRRINNKVQNQIDRIFEEQRYLDGKEQKRSTLPSIDILEKAYITKKPYFDYNSSIIEKGKIYSAVDVLNYIKQDPQYKELVSIILKSLETQGDIKIAGISDTSLKNSSYGGLYSFDEDNGENAIYINTASELYQSDPIHTILHELIHGITSIALHNNPTLEKQIEQYMQYLIDNGVGNDFMGMRPFMTPYGLKANGKLDSHEFVAEFMTNKDFQDFLKHIPAMEDSQFKSIFDSIIDWILNILGVNKNAYDQIKPIVKFVIEYQDATVNKISSTPNIQAHGFDENGNTIGDMSEFASEIGNNNGNSKHIKFLNNISQDIENYAIKQAAEEIQKDSTIDPINAVHKAKKDWIEQRQKEIIGETQQKLVEAYGLKQEVGEDGRIRFVKTGNAEIDLIVDFLDYISEADGYYDHNSKSTAAHHTIAIALSNGDPSTFNHELAHHYVRMFWNSEVIQNALAAVYKEGMTDIEVEEALVDIITAKTTDSEFMSCVESQSFFQKFWGMFANMLYKTFHLENEAIKKQLCINAARAFAVNKEQKALDAETRLFTMYQGRVYKKHSSYKEKMRAKRQALRTSDSIIEYQEFGGDKTQRAIHRISQGVVSRNKEFRKQSAISPSALVQMQTQEDMVKQFIQDIKEYRDRWLEAAGLSGKRRLRKKERFDMSHTTEEINRNVELIRDFIETAQIELDDILRKLKASSDSKYTLSIKREIVNPSTGEVETEYLDSSHMSDPDVTVEEITFEELTSMYQNVIGFYGSALQQLYEAVTDEEFADVYGNDIKNEILNALSATSGVATTVPLMPIMRDVQTYYNHAVEFNTKFYVTKYVRNAMKDLPDDYVERAIYSVTTWLNNQNVWGDSRALDSWLTLASHNKSTLIVDEINIKTHFEGEKKAQTLNALREKAIEATRKHFLKQGKAYGTISPFNFDKVFIEKDRNGKPTGNFASEVNIGQYYIDREDAINELLYGKNGYEKQIRILSGDKSFELDIDDEGNPIFPEAYEDLEKQYRHDLNHWTAKHAVRAFTEEYYDKKIDMLSKVTENAVDAIDKDIKRILYSCTIDGKIHTELLKPSKMEALSVLYYQKQQLANPYDRYGREKPIGSEERQIADELTAWNNWVADNVAYKKDIEAYEAAKAGAKDPDAFERKNTYPIVNPEIWRELERLRPKMTNDEIEKLKLLRSKLKSRVKGKGIKIPSLDVVWDANTKNIRAGYEEFWKNLKQIDEEYYSLIYQVKKRLGLKEPSKAEKAKVAKLIGTVPAKRKMGNGTTKSWVEFIETQIDERVEAENPNDPFIKQKKDEAKNIIRVEVKDETGDVVEIRYLSIFDIYKAPTANVIIDGKSVPGIIHEPIQAYSVIDPENSNPLFVDKRFNFGSDEFVQPITDNTKRNDDDISYTNHDFIKNIKNGPAELRNYYNALLNTMKDAYQNIPFAGKHDGRLVQKGGYTGQLWQRDILSNGLFGLIGAGIGSAVGSVVPVAGTAIGGLIGTIGGAIAGMSMNSILYWLGRTFYVNESDNDINIDFQLRPDGSRSMNIPVRYIKRIENQRNINTDILGTVIEFYNMSLNYKYKSEKLPVVQSIIHNVSNSNTGRTGQLNALKGIMNRQFYERLRVLDFGEDNKVSYKAGWQKVLLKFLPFLRSLSTVGLLALNWISAIVAWLDPATQVLTEAIVGKQYNIGDYIATFPKLIWSLPGAILGTGRVKHVHTLGMGYTAGAIDHFGLGRTVTGIYSHMDRSQGLSRFALEDIVMRPFSLGEYTVNAQVVELVLGRYKLFTDLKTGQQRFMDKREYLQHAYDNGIPLSTARKNWHFNFDTLRRAYHVNKQGIFEPKAKFSSLITEEFETMIAKEMRSKSTIANLIVPSTERTGWQTNIIVAFTTVMRTFLLVAISERAKSLHDFQIDDESTVDEMRISDTQRQLSEDYWMDQGGFNFQTRTIDDGIWKGLWHYLSHARYFKYTLWRMRHPFRSTIDDKVKDKKEQLQISNTDLYAMDRFLTEVGLFMLIATISVLFHNKMIDDGDDDKYGYQLIDHLLMRWAIVRMTFFSPDTVFDIITSVSASITDIENKLTVFQLLGELYTGLNEHGFNFDDWDKVKGQSAYKGKPKAFRSLLKTFSGLGLHSAYSSASVEGIKSKTKWYLRLAYWRFLLNKNEKSQTKGTKKSSSKGWNSDYSNSDYKTDKYNSDWN